MKKASLDRLLVAAVFVAGLFAAVTAARAQLPPPGPAAPASSVVPAGMAMVADSVLGGDRSSSYFTFPASGSGEAIFFVVQEVDGQRVESSLGASRRMSQGMGARMRVALVERP